MLTGVFSIGMGVYADILRFNIANRGNLLVLGQAGIGKTEIPQQIAAELGFQAHVLDLSVLEAPDLVGLPIITEKRQVVYATPEHLPRVTDGGKPIVLIVDELDKAKPELQNPMLSLFQTHMLNGIKFNIQAIVATGNLPDEGAFSQPISHALTNRCKVYRVETNFDAWQENAANRGVNALVIGFLGKNQEMLSRPSVEGDPTAYTRPSPRSWTQAAAELDATMAPGALAQHRSVEFQTLLVAGRVGMEAATKFRVWLEHYRHLEPMIEKLCKEGKAPDPRELSIDRQMVCAIAAVSEVSNQMRKHQGEAAKHKEAVQKLANNVFGWVVKLPTEFQIAAVKSSLVMELVQKFELVKVEPCMKTFLAVRKAIND